MSFDLFVWHETEPITADAAREKLDRWDDGEPGVFATDPAVARFYDALLDRFTALESDVERPSVWTSTPLRSDEIVVASISWSRTGEAGAAVMELAAAHGLICYEPGGHIVNPNAPGYVPAFTLSSENTPKIPDPDERRVARLLAKVGSGNRWILLERADGWFVQIGYAAGAYTLEYQEGGLDRHYSTRTTDLIEATRFLQEFLVGDETWKRRHVWKPVEL